MAIKVIKTEKTLLCSVCHAQIKVDGDDFDECNRTIRAQYYVYGPPTTNAGNLQIWEVEGESFAVCDKCCDVIKSANALGLITAHDEQLYIKAGFKEMAKLAVKSA